MSRTVYRYARFKDLYKEYLPMDQRLMFVGKPDDRLIEELGLEKQDEKTYYASLYTIGEKGWQLKFTVQGGRKNQQFGAIFSNTYIFEKAETVGE